MSPERIVDYAAHSAVFLGAFERRTHLEDAACDLAAEEIQIDPRD
jgi:hypothetical protein